MNKNLTVQQAGQLIKNWDGAFSMKQHQGEIRMIEMTKEYDMTVPIRNEFIEQITPLYRFLEVRGNKQKLVLTASVKAETMDEFIGFVKSLKAQEAKLTLE